MDLFVQDWLSPVYRECFAGRWNRWLECNLQFIILMAFWNFDRWHREGVEV